MITSFSFFESAKNFFSYFVSSITGAIYSPDIVFLPRKSSSEISVEEIVKKQFAVLSHQEKNRVYHKVWELAKMNNPEICGETWGQDHVLDDIPRLRKALSRLGFFSEEKDKGFSVRCLPSFFGEGGLRSQYFSLFERQGKEPIKGQVGYINGMGVPNLEHAGRDAASFSDKFLNENNVHCVYNATHQNAPSGDLLGFFIDILRMKAVNGGSYTKSSYLIAQQWIDFLISHPDKNYLQIAHSEGAVHVNAALRLIKSARPDLLQRIRVITMCPAYFILPETYGHGFQAINLFKNEDGAINPWAVGINKASTSEHIITVKHREDHPHNHLSNDYIREGKVYVDEFLRSGNLY